MKTPDAARAIIYLMNVFQVEPIHDVVCGTKAILANDSPVSRIGRVLGDDSLRKADATIALATIQPIGTLWFL